MHQLQHISYHSHEYLHTPLFLEMIERGNDIFQVLGCKEREGIVAVDPVFASLALETCDQYRHHAQCMLSNVAQGWPGVESFSKLRVGDCL